MAKDWAQSPYFWRRFRFPGDDRDWAGAASGVAGWESHDISVTTALVNGEPRVIGLVIEPKSDVDFRDQVLTSNRLRTLPVTALAASAHAVLAPEGPLVYLGPGLVDLLKDLARQDPKPPGRASTTVERVADVYSNARQQGLAPRKSVCEALNISPRTADRYISEARRSGLLPPYDERKAGSRDAETE